MLMEKQTNLTRETQQRKRSAEPLLAPPSDTLSTVLALIERTTLDPSAGVEKLDRLAVMYERLKTEEAELAFNAAKGSSKSSPARSTRKRQRQAAKGDL
jgi:hypothetical protein